MCIFLPFCAGVYVFLLHFLLFFVFCDFYIVLFTWLLKQFDVIFLVLLGIIYKIYFDFWNSGILKRLIVIFFFIGIYLLFMNWHSGVPICENKPEPFWFLQSIKSNIFRCNLRIKLYNGFFIFVFEFNFVSLFRAWFSISITRRRLLLSSGQIDNLLPFFCPFCVFFTIYFIYKFLPLNFILPRFF